MTRLAPTSVRDIDIGKPKTDVQVVAEATDALLTSNQTVLESVDSTQSDVLYETKRQRVGIERELLDEEFPDITDQD